MVGGSFGGVAAALTFARAGRQVILVEPRTYLGREITATLRPWVNVSEVDPLPGLIATCVDVAGAVPVSGEIPLKPDALKLCLEDLLLEAGVALIYASLPLGVVAEAGSLRGLAIGNKSGRQVLACRTIVDATATAAVIRAAGATFEPAVPALSHYSRTLEFDGALSPRQADLPVPEDLGFVGDHVVLHPGYRDEGHLFVECPMELLFAGANLEQAMNREIEARHRTMRLASHLINRVSAFHHAYLTAASYELYGPHTPSIAGPTPAWATLFDTIHLPVMARGETAVPLSTFAGPLSDLWCLSEAARLAPEQIAGLRDPVTASLVGAALAQQVVAHQGRVRPAGSLAPSLERVVGANTGTPTIGVMEPANPQRGREYAQQPVPPTTVPLLRTSDVLVVGGGTSGATAAITSAREGMRTTLLEMNPGLGGTATLGGVDSYWFGRRVGFSERVARWVEEVHDRLDYEGRRWNIEAKMYALLREVERAGVEVFLNAQVVGAVVEGNQVRGIVVATRYGLFGVLADVIIDATGDGDVAAFAGAEFAYGSERDQVVMWYSLAQFAKPGHTQNNFTSMVDVSNVEDYTRAVLAGRRRGEDCHDHGVYVAPRESRHIVGDEVLTLTDQLRQRRWPDVINIHFSNHDVKGHTGSDWLRAGLIPPSLEVEIPYRILLPKGLERILVVGKAVSTTHDGLPAIRMQADLENLGGVVALAAAQAIREGVAPRHMDLKTLQQRLVTEGILPEEILTRTVEPSDYTDEELEALVDSLDADRPLHAYSDMKMGDVFRGPIPFVEICAAGPPAVPILERALTSAQGARRVRIAQALAMLGSSAGVPTLIAEIERHLADGTLPARESRIHHAGFPPDQGAMPEVVYLIYTLGMARDRRSLAVWERVAELLAPTEESIRDRYQGVFYYVDAICFGAERLGDAAAIPILEKLHAHPPLRDQVTREGFQPDYFRERQAMLELAIGRALARCGSPRGLSVLIAYLDDNRALLAEQAHSELVAISGQDFGKDSQSWSQWLAGAGDPLASRPFRAQMR